MRSWFLFISIFYLFHFRCHRDPWPFFSPNRCICALRRNRWSRTQWAINRQFQNGSTKCWEILKNEKLKLFLSSSIQTNTLLPKVRIIRVWSRIFLHSQQLFAFSSVRSLLPIFFIFLDRLCNWVLIFWGLSTPVFRPIFALFSLALDLFLLQRVCQHRCWVILALTIFWNLLKSRDSKTEKYWKIDSEHHWNPLRSSFIYSIIILLFNYYSVIIDVGWDFEYNQRGHQGTSFNSTPITSYFQFLLIFLNRVTERQRENMVFRQI